MNPINALPLGTILPSGQVEYKIEKVLGQGGFGITYLVTGEILVGNVPTEAKFAIKEYFPSAFAVRDGKTVKPQPDKTAEYERGKTDFISEAKKLHALGAENANIVKVNEVFEANGTAYYVMQYINGQSLTSYVKARKKLSYSEALAILAPIIDAVGFLHASRINHLDIKPDNIMLHDSMKGMVPVLIDFGLSVHFKKNGEKTSPKGVQGVSEGYSPMEQYAGIREFIPAADIYSLMATLLFALTGETPKSASEIKMTEIRNMLAKIAPEDAIEGICKAMNKSYEDRTDSIQLLKSDLGLTHGGTITNVIDVADEKRRKNRMTIFGIIAAVVVIALIIIFALPGKDKKANPTPIPTPDSTLVSDSLSSTSEESSETVTEEVKVTEEVRNPEPQATEPTKNQDTKTSSAATPTSAENRKPEPTPKPESRPEPKAEKPAAATSGSLSLGYGTWTGGIKNGKPDGKGKIVFHSSHRVDRSTSVEANAGDYFVATYDNGSLISGKLYDSSGNLLKTIIP